jgi:hypothetical protein
MSDKITAPTLPTAPSLEEWNDVTAIENDKRIEDLQKMFTILKKTNFKNEKKTKRKNIQLKTLQYFNYGLYFLEYPIIFASLFFPPMMSVALPTLAGTSIFHVLSTKVENTLTKKIASNITRGHVTNQIIDQLSDRVDRASEDGIVTKEEFSEIYKNYQKTMYLLSTIKC